MRLLPPGIDAARARQRTRAGRLWGWLGAEQGLRLELVYLPHYRFHVAAGDGSSGVTALLDAAGGLLSLLAPDSPLPDPLREVDVHVDVLPTLIDRRSAERRVRAELAEAAQRQARRNGLTSPDPVQLIPREPLAFPYWVRHLKRWGRRDFRAVDGLTGEPVSVRLRRSLVLAFIGAAQRPGPSG